MTTLVSHTVFNLCLLYAAYRVGVLNERANPVDIDGLAPWKFTRAEWIAHGKLGLIFLVMLYMDIALWGDGLNSGG